MPGVRDAATVVIARDSPDLEVLMLRRSDRVQFVPGAHVFPGGAVDRHDRDPRLEKWVVGLDDVRASALVGVDSGALGLWVAAVREAFEEAEILLARSDSAQTHPDPSLLAELRVRLNRHEATVADLLGAADARIHTDDLLILSHYVTPPGNTRRYDTWFFVAAAPPGQQGAHDESETVHSEWVSPVEILDRSDRGQVRLIGPTAETLVLLSRYERAGDLLGELRDAHRGGTGRRIVRDGWGERVLLASDLPAGATRSSWTQPLVPPKAPRPFGADDDFGEEGVA